MELLYFPDELILGIADSMSNETKYYFSECCVYLRNLLDVRLTVFPARLVTGNTKIYASYGCLIYDMVIHLCLELKATAKVCSRKKWFNNYLLKHSINLNYNEGVEVILIELKNTYVINVEYDENDENMKVSKFSRIRLFTGVVNYKIIDLQSGNDFEELVAATVERQFGRCKIFHDYHNKYMLDKFKKFKKFCKNGDKQIINHSVNNDLYYLINVAHIWIIMDNLNNINNLLYQCINFSTKSITIYTFESLVPVVRAIVAYISQTGKKPYLRSNVICDLTNDYSDEELIDMYMVEWSENET